MYNDLRDARTASPQFERIRLVTIILLVGFGAALLFGVLPGIFLHLGYPFDTIFYRPEVRFLDFYFPYTIATDPFRDIVDESIHRSQFFEMPPILSGDKWEMNRLGPVYFPFAYWIVWPFRLFPLGLGLILFWILTIGVFLFLCLKHVGPTGGLLRALVVFACSYPLLFLLNRSNFEIVVFIFVYIFLFTYNRRALMGAIALGCAIAMKFLPVAYLLLYLRDRKYKEVLLALGAAAILNIVAYALYPRGLFNNIYTHLINLRISSLFYALDGRDIALNSSLSAGVKYSLLVFSARPDIEAISLQADKILSSSGPLLIGFIAVWCVFVEKELWKRAVLVTCAILLFPASSADYRLILLYPPFFLWLDRPEGSRFDAIYAILFGALFMPKPYFHPSAFPEASISSLANPVLMLMMILTAIFDRKQVGDKKEEMVSPAGDKPRFRLQPVLIAGIATLILGAGYVTLQQDFFQENQKRAVNQDVVQAMQTYGQEAEENSHYLDAIGYYAQWLALEPQNPEPRLGMARSYVSVGRSWEAYQLYKKVLWLSGISVENQREAIQGIQTALNHTVCDMLEMRRFRWSELLKKEYENQFPKLPTIEQFECVTNP